MNAIDPDPDLPAPFDAVPPPASPLPKRSLVKTKREAQRAADELGLVTCQLKHVDALSHLGKYLDEIGAMNVGMGFYMWAADHAKGLLDSVKLDLAECSEVNEIKVAMQGNAIKLISALKDIGEVFVKTKPVASLSNNQLPMMPSFPAGAIIPAPGSTIGVMMKPETKLEVKSPPISGQ